MSESTVQSIPKSLIYEMVDGEPIYYRGYKDYLSGEKQLEELMGSSYIQSLIVTRLVIMLSKLLDTNKYEILTNELGLKFKDKTWRAADLSIYNKNDLRKLPLSDKYLEVAPKIVIEVDTKADLSEVPDSFSYYQKKTDQLLDFEIEKVIWIFTDTKKMMVAEPDKNWQISPWDKEVQILDDTVVTLQKLVEEAS